MNRKDFLFFHRLYAGGLAKKISLHGRRNTNDESSSVLIPPLPALAAIRLVVDGARMALQ